MDIECLTPGQTPLFAPIEGYKSTDPALSDLGCGRSVRVLFAPPAIFLPASLPSPSRNILRARANPLGVAVEALQGRSEQKIRAPVVSEPGHELAART